MLFAALLLAAGLEPVDLGGKVLDVRVADVDADGFEDLVAVTAAELLLFRGNEGGITRDPAVRAPAPPLCVVGRGYLGVVREGRLHHVADPFGEWRESEPDGSSLLGALGGGAPALLDAPGDLTGDGRDDPLVATATEFRSRELSFPVAPEAALEIHRNEAFAVVWSIPVPAVGSWTGKAREAVFLRGDDLLAARPGEIVERIPLPLSDADGEASDIRTNHVLVRDVDGDGRLDLVVVRAKGAAGVFAVFEATAMLFAGGRVYDHDRKGFFRPKSLVRVSGMLLRPALHDLDGDGDLDLSLSTVDTSILAGATGSAPGTTHVFLHGEDGFARAREWTIEEPVPLASFQEKPRPPVALLPDLDGDGAPEALVLGATVRLLKARRGEAFQEAARAEAGEPGPLSCGRTFAALATTRGVILVEAE